MAYNEHLADRIRQVLSRKGMSFVEKKMMGGLCFMVAEKMCVGVESNMLMARVGADNYQRALSRPGCKPMDFTGRPLTGFVFVEDAGIDSDENLSYWIQLCLDFNPLAKRSRPRKKK